MRILIVEDERKTAEALKLGLAENGYETEVASDGKDGLDKLKLGGVHLIITDVIMPSMNGIDFCTEVRKINSQIPILMLTALGSKDDVITGLDAGADDYLTKPFDFRELVARIRSLTKRMDISNSDQLKFSDLTMDLKQRTVIRAGKTIELTVKEFTLLEYFITHPNKVLSRADLARDVWKIDFDTGTNIVEVYINYLRNKIDKPFEKKLIHNIHGIGYIMKEA